MIRLSLLVFCFLFSFKSFAIERYAIGAYEGWGYNCNQAIFHAQAACADSMEAFTKEYDVVEPPVCSSFNCYCWGGNVRPRAVCPGKALYEDGMSYSTKKRSLFTSFRGQGYSCWHARYEAVRDMYRGASRMSRRRAITQFQLESPWDCRCGGYGPSALCTGSFSYAEAAPVVDPEPVEPEPVDPAPVDPEPVDPEPVDPEPEPEPVEPEPVDPQPQP